LGGGIHCRRLIQSSPIRLESDSSTYDVREFAPAVISASPHWNTSSCRDSDAHDHDDDGNSSSGCRLGHAEFVYEQFGDVVANAQDQDRSLGSENNKERR
jgi:hypothetical protein